MKRRTAQNVGHWPNMREYTLKQIADELVRARKKHPDPGRHFQLLESYTFELNMAARAFLLSRNGSAAQVFASACAVAAMAIRIAEEGSIPFVTYPKASGNPVQPEFSLTSDFETPRMDPNSDIAD